MATPIRVLILSKDPTFFSSGEGTMGDTLKRHLKYAEALRERAPGSEVRIVTYAPRTAAGPQTFTREGFQLDGTCSRHRATYMWGLFKRLWGLRAAGWRPDVVTVQTPWEEGVVGLLLAKLAGARFIPQLHFDMMSEAWVREHALNAWRRQVAIRVLRRATRIRVVSRQQAEKLVSGLSLTADRLRVVPVGVQFAPAAGDRAVHKEALSPGLSAKHVVLFVGRFAPPKNLALWVDVAERVARQRGDVAFVLAGDGPLMETVRQDVADRGLNECFHLLGAVAHDRLPQVYAAADVFLLTSSHEGFGRVLLEAGLAGVPVVSTACVGPLDLIQDDETGVLRPLDDAAGLADAVLGLLADDARRHRLGGAARRRMEETFSADALTRQLVALWADP